MKAAFIQLLYKQLYQEQLLNKMFLEDENSELYDTVVDNLQVLLDMIGYPTETDQCIDTNGDIISRDWYYQRFTEIQFKDIEDEAEIKQSISDYLYWVCKQTKKICRKEDLGVNKYLKNLLKEYKSEKYFL